MVSGKHPVVVKESLRKRLKRFGRYVHFWRLLCALILAIGTCYVMHNQGAAGVYAAQSVVRGIKVSVDKGAAVSGLYVLPDQDLHVDLQIRVDAFHHSTQYHPEQFEIQIDKVRLYEKLLNAKETNVLAEPQEVEYEILEADIIRKPQGVAPRDEGNVPRIKVKCDRMSFKEVPVHLRLDRRNETAGWTYECKLENQSVLVSGPQYLLARLESLPTEPVVVTGKETYHGMASLVLPDELSILNMSVSRVEYEVKPQKDAGGNIVRAFNLPVFFLTRGNSQLQIVSKPGELQRSVEVRLHGPAKLLKNLDVEKLRVYGDLTEESMEGKRNVKLHVFGVPEGIGLEGFWPQDELTVDLGYHHDTKSSEEVIPLPSVSP